MKLLLEFLMKVFKQWVLLLSLLPKMYDMLDAYFDIAGKLPSYVTNIFIVVIIVIAFFLVWKQEKNSKLLLEDKLKNPVDYEITAKLIPFTINKYIESFESHLTEEYKEVEKFKKKQVKTIVIDVDNYVVNKSLSDSLHISNKSLDFFQKMAEEKDKEMQKLAKMMSNLESYSSPKYTKSNKQYDTEMKVYRNDLENFYEDYYTHKEKMLEEIESCLKNKYFVEFEIKNIGNTSDENIDITINTGKNSLKKKFGLSCECLKHIPNKPERPEPPKEINRFNEGFNTDNLSINQPYIPDNSNAYIRNYIIEENHISVTFREMNVGDVVAILADEVIINLERDNQEMNFVLKSKKSNSVIRKNIKLVFVNNIREFIDIKSIG